MWYGFFQTTCTGGGAKGGESERAPQIRRVLYRVNSIYYICVQLRPHTGLRDRIPTIFPHFCCKRLTNS